MSSVTPGVQTVASRARRPQDDTDEPARPHDTDGTTTGVDVVGCRWRPYYVGSTPRILGADTALKLTRHKPPDGGRATEYKLIAKGTIILSHAYTDGGRSG